MKASHVFWTGLRVAGYKMGRRFSFPLPMPVNLAIVPTGRCNSMCRTCNIWKTPVSDELDAGEWDRIFKSIGRSHPWVTASEGEPFLSKDLVEITRNLVEHTDPQIMVFPTNGILTEKITDDVREILGFYGGILIINFSLDGVGNLHDEIRGVRGNFRRVVDSVSAMKDVKRGSDNLVVGINTVVSKHNIKKIDEISDFVKNELKPDSHIFEIADNREALNNAGMDLRPGCQEYLDAIGRVSGDSNVFPTGFFRKRYYRLVEEMLLKGRGIIPCYAGIASAQISSTGEVWACCRMCESMGNLRENGYDFRKVWKSRQAMDVRRGIKERKCWCTSANANYTNILCSFIRLAGV